jgi:hypothetical protein
MLFGPGRLNFPARLARAQARPTSSFRRKSASLHARAEAGLSGIEINNFETILLIPFAAFQCLERDSAYASFESQEQGDRMSLRKSRPKCGPTHFFVKFNTRFLPWKNVARKV